MPQAQNDDHALEMRISPTEIKDAPAPFDDRDADVILRSCDLVDFRVFKLVLSLASPVFKSMFTLPQAPSHSQTAMVTDDDHRDGLPVVRLSEDGRTLEDMLRACYPGTSPRVDSLEDIARILVVTEKYEMEAFRMMAREMVSKGFEDHPVSRYIIACRFEFKDIITKTAIACLTQRHKTILQYTSPLWPLITAEQYRRLTLFHYHAGEIASKIPFSKRWLNTLPLFMMSPVQVGCTNCREKRSVPAVGGDDTTVFYAPGCVWEYLTRTARSLKEWPCAMSASCQSVLKGIADPALCGLCGADRRGMMAVVRHSLADAINEAIAVVSSPCL